MPRAYNSAADTLSRLEVPKFLSLHSSGRCFQLNPRWLDSLLLSLFGVQSAVVDAGYSKFWSSSPRLQRLVKGLVKRQDAGVGPSGRLPRLPHMMGASSHSYREGLFRLGELLPDTLSGFDVLR
mmetsp:Transcript_3015/g.4587  ORF Transcript_3015/g.4587 Transcript_3015/m.4587 type:complete len:124 (-) Transcript_3015:171-542(-)